MSLSITSNISTLNIQRNLNVSAPNVAPERLQTGAIAKTVQDDGAVLHISEKLMRQVRTLDPTARELNEAITHAQLAEKEHKETNLSLDATAVNTTTLGTSHNRFTATLPNTLADLGALINTSSTRRLIDDDFAADLANRSKNLILDQHGSSILAQANMLPSAVLSLVQ